MKSQKANSSQSRSDSVAPVVLFGLDPSGKPKAGKFTDKHATLALKAAGHMQLQVLAISDPKIAELATHLPAGRIHANGRGFVPFIRRDLYGRLLAAASVATPPTNHAGTPGGSSDSTGDGGRRPTNWDDIRAGDLVVAQDSLPEGWYATIVAERNGDMLTLRWRDFPRERRFTVHRFTVALLRPGGDLGPAQAKRSAGAASAKAQPGKSNAEMPAASDRSTVDHPFPGNWDQIDVNHLVLAKDDGPWRSWWEAIPAENNGELLTLRWRDHSHLGPFVRRRFDLALLYPKTK